MPIKFIPSVVVVQHPRLERALREMCGTETIADKLYAFTQMLHAWRLIPDDESVTDGKQYMLNMIIDRYEEDLNLQFDEDRECYVFNGIDIFDL